MIYTALTCKAIKIAYDAHQGQLDKNGVPYIFHPYHLAEQMTDEYTTCAALLHDVVEDTDVTFEELEKEFPAQVITALRLLTHDDSVDYFDYVRNLKSDPIARAVKLADLRHNSDLSRYLTEDQRNDPKVVQRMEKYAKAIALLTDEN